MISLFRLRKFTAGTGLCLAFLGPSFSADHSIGGGGRPGTIEPGPVWDDGLAEIARYDATRVIYGEERGHEALFITVKERFDLDRAVKADPPYDGRRLGDVLKQNQISEIATPNYPYRYMASVFVERENPWRAVKTSVSSQEWCGTSFHRFDQPGGAAAIEYRTYFDGEAEGTIDLDFKRDDLIEDQLPLTLRYLRYDRPFSTHARLLPGFVSNRAPTGVMREMIIEYSGKETIRAAGREWDCFRVEVSGDGVIRLFHIADDESRTLVRYRAGDGRSLTLESIERRDYWTRK